MTNAKFGSNRAGTWVDGAFGSNRTKKPTGTKKSEVEKPKAEKPEVQKIVSKKKVIQKKVGK
jgi:hypothetical protein